MSVFSRETRVAAPLSAVWEFHSRVEGLVALTPGWVRLRVERIEGPDGELDHDVLVEGTRVTLSVRPFGVGPRRAWTSEIVERTERERSAVFRDEMVEGPFDRWVHTHRFHAEDGSTRVRDRVEYRLPGGALGRMIDPLATVGLAPTFRYRHRRTRELLGGKQ